MSATCTNIIIAIVMTATLLFVGALGSIALSTAPDTARGVQDGER